jgi:hypothetical protein
MKLKCIKTFTADFVINKEFDPYVCLDLSINKDSVTGPPIYWRLADPKFCLIEIAIDRNSGRLVAVTVVMYQGNLRKADTLERQDLSIKRAVGLPVFSRDLWSKSSDIYDTSKDFYDVQGKCQLEASATEVRINLFPDKIGSCIEIPNQLTCECNQHDELCAILVKGLTKQDISILNECIGQRQ